ncbi:MAG: DUF438 domain-containing protein [Candidatus Bathyarchaeota archaeon]|nr:MAG: DUF438 domain-containing protein [Candidatus Bathyarchaeota archaeon]
MSNKPVNNKDFLKSLIRKLHDGADVEEIKEEFRNVLKDVSPAIISQAEEELIAEGMPRGEIRRLCDIHLAIFKESMEKEKTIAPSGHPIHTLMEEHKILLRFSTELVEFSRKIKGARSTAMSEDEEQLNHIIKHLKESESHYLREENVLFPYLEKHGITQPPAVMWTEHDNIRKIEKDLYKTVDTGKGGAALQNLAEQLENISLILSETLSNHFYKENHILFQAALEVIETAEWTEIRKQFDEVGYCCFTPESAGAPESKKVRTHISEGKAEDTVQFETGSFSEAELTAVLNTLPVDITFIDKNDVVRYFSQGKERIFVRTKAIIGRKVQQCHPQKSVHKVNQILDAFKRGGKDPADFWINLEGRLIYIRYFPVRNEKREYLGCLEVTQDITEIKEIEGEKRLLDWH